MSEDIDPVVCWRAIPHLLVTRCAGRVAMLGPGDESPLILEGTAEAIWDLIDGRSLREISAQLHEIYDVGIEEAGQSVTSVLRTLEMHGIIHPCPADGRPA